jgi:FKBP-type peptidyl-prolyl cis-trans isomerase FklB
MKKLLILLCAAMIMTAPGFAQKKDAKEKDKSGTNAPVKMKNHIDTISYIIGADIGRNFKTNNIEVNPEVFMAGFMTGKAGGESCFTKPQVDTIMKYFQEEMMKKMEAEKGKKSEDAKIKGKAFLDQNKTQPGVKVLPSGLQFKVISEGSGMHPVPTDTVSVNYTGTFIDGTTFDSNKGREPISFPLNRVIPGWTEGLQLMQPGAKYMFYIPSDLGYGDREAGPIPPGSTLIFEVELLSVKH